MGDIMDEFKKYLFKLEGIEFPIHNLNSLDNSVEIEDSIIVMTDDFEKAFAFKTYNRVSNKNNYLVIEENSDLEAVVKNILGEDKFNRLPKIKQFHNDVICRYLGVLSFSSHSANEYTHLRTYLKNNFEETEDEVKHYELFDKNIVIVPAEFHQLAKTKIMASV